MRKGERGEGVRRKERDRRKRRRERENMRDLLKEMHTRVEKRIKDRDGR